MRKTTYDIKGIPTTIRFTSRASIKVGDRYYTLEACEERLLPALDDLNVEEERKALWDTVNSECDSQIADILEMYKEEQGRKRKY